MLLSGVKCIYCYVIKADLVVKNLGSKFVSVFVLMASKLKLVWVDINGNSNPNYSSCRVKYPVILHVVSLCVFVL